MNVPDLLRLPWALCVRNDDYPVSLELRKLYPVLPDADAAQHDFIRVIDESGEDYLYPADYFLMIDVPPPGDAAP